MANRKILSFNEIVSTITTKIGNKSANITDFSPGSNIRAIVDAIAHFVEFIQLQINIAFDAFTVRGARGADLDNRVQDFNITRKPAVNAKGVITFSRPTPSPETFIIYAGSQVSTQPDVFGNTVDYIVANDIIFPAGETSINGNIVCTVPGTIGNQPSGVITNITGNLPGIQTITNQAAVTDGADIETDEQLRARLIEHVNGLKAGNNAAIKAAALAVPGITVARIDENVPRSGEFTVYISNQSGILTTEQITSVKDAVDEIAAFGITANVATPTVTNVGISFDVSYDNTYYNQSEIDEQIRTAIWNFASVNPGTDLKIVDIILQVKTVKGINNIKNVKINNVADDFTTEVFGVIRLQNKYSSISINYV